MNPPTTSPNPLSIQVAIKTEIHANPQNKVVHFWLATGVMASVLRLHYDVLAWARELGCTRATLAGRRGWEKALASEGWAPELILMGREIGDGKEPGE